LRDLVASERHPIAGGGFDVIPEHQAFGNEGVVDPTNITGILAYDSAPTVLYVYESTDVESDGTVAIFGTYSVLEYDKTTAYTGGMSQPALFGGTSVVKFEQGSGATGQTFNDGVFGQYSGVYHAGGVAPGWIQGDTGGVAAIAANVTALGASPSDPGDIDGVNVGFYTERTGAYNVYGFHAYSPTGAGVMDGLFGVYIAAMTQGAVQSWNIFSAGATSKNKLEGRLFQGTPNSAPTDSHLGNGQISAYLDEAANKIKWRARYSDGTLKTGEVALT
jgi:hypothetical protein